MINYENFISKKIGNLIKTTRKDRALSQKELANGICSQAMLSSIENNKYLPNVALFLALCNKLNLSVDANFLNQKLQFDYNQELSDKLFALCKKHQYQELIKYLDNSKILACLNTDPDYQIYYYYHGCSNYQLTHDLLSCKRDFELAISYTSAIKEFNPKTEIELLLLNSLGVISMELCQDEKAELMFNTVNKKLKETDIKSENLNVIFFQQGMVNFNRGNYSKAVEKFIQGIKFLESNGSTFMLNNYFQKITESYQKL